MNAIILLLFAVDPTGLQAAFESAGTVDLSYDWTGFKVTLVNPETIKKLAPLVEVKGEAIRSNALPGTPELIRVTIRGKKTTEFWMVNSKIGFDGQLIDPTDDKLWVALRAYFEPPTQDPEKGIPVVEEDVTKTLAAAMKGADKLEISYRGVKMDYSLGNEPAKEQVLGFLKLAGDVTQNAKKPKDPVEIAFVNKETRIPIYLVGETAYWGDNNKRWKSVKLTSHTLWRQMVTVIPKGEIVDRTGFKAAVESAESVELSHRGKTVTLKGETLEEIALLPALGPGGGAMTPGNKFLEGKEIIDIVVRKDKETTNFKLARDKDDLYLVFNQNLLGKMTNMDLWEEIQGQFPSESAFPAKPEYSPKKEVPKEEPDPTGLKAAIRAAETMRVNFPSGGFTTTAGGDPVAKTIPPVLVKGEIGPVDKKDAAAKVIEIVLTKGEKSVKFLLIRGPNADSLVFGDKQATLSDRELWKRISPND